MRTAPTEIYTLSLHDALPISFRRAAELQPDNLLAVAGLASTASRAGRHAEARAFAQQVLAVEPGFPDALVVLARDRKSTRLNSSHRCISYAVFCLKKKNSTHH